jgi:hypothetical protein
LGFSFSLALAPGFSFVRSEQAGAKQAAEKLISVEGDGLQAVHNRLEMNSALAAEG